MGSFPTDTSQENANRKIVESKDPFGNQKTAQVTPVIEQLPKPAITKTRDRTVTNNSGSVTSDLSKITLSSGTTTGSDALLETVQWGRYLPGFSANIGIRIRVPTAPTGDAEARWGYYNEKSGIIKGEDSTGYFIQRRSGGTDDPKIRPSDFEIGLPDWFSLRRGVINRSHFTHYGEGIWHESVYAGHSSDDKEQVYHSITKDGNDPILDQPNLPIRCEVDNGTTNQDLSLEVIGRQFHVSGKYQPSRKPVTETRESQTLTTSEYVPLVSYRFKRPALSGVEDYRPVEVKMRKVEINSETDPVRFQVRTGCSLTGASWGNPTDMSASESPVQSDVSATALSGGEKIDGGSLEGGKNEKTAVEENDLNISPPMPKYQNVTVAAKLISGNDQNARCTFRLKAEM